MSRARGRFYENGPITCCDDADVHAQPCLCAATSMPTAAEMLAVYRSEVYQDEPTRCFFFPDEDTAGQQ